MASNSESSGFQLGQPLQFSQPMQQLPPWLLEPNIPQTQQTALHLNKHMPSFGGRGAPFYSSHAGSFSSSHTQRQATLGSQQFCSVGMPSSQGQPLQFFQRCQQLPVQFFQPMQQGQPLQFSQPTQQLPPWFGQPKMPQTQQTDLHLNKHMPGFRGPGAPFYSSYAGSFSSSHTQPNAANVSSQCPPSSQMHAYGASHVTPSATAAEVRITETMQVSLIMAEDIIGIAGATVGYIHRTSGANLSVAETMDNPEEATVEIKGTVSQVKRAQRLIQECIDTGTSSNP